MKPRLVAAAAVAGALLLSSCSLVTGSGTSTTESRPVSGFTAVDLSGSGELTIEQTGTESLSITAENNILPKLTSQVTGGTLHLGTKGGALLRPTQPIIYKLTVKDLSKLDLSGSGVVSVPKLTTTTLTVGISGSGTMSVAGTADAQRVSLSGSGSYQAKDLITRTATIDVSGSGEAEVNASERLEVDLSGSGTLTYHGDPTLKKDISGSGKLIKAS